jgi:flagellar motor switch protein FliN/FliY
MNRYGESSISAALGHDTGRPSESPTREAYANGAEGPGLDLIKRIPVSVQVVLGSATMTVAELMQLGRGSVVTLDRGVGEPVEILVNGRVVARGEVVVIEEENCRLGVSLTEIVGTPSATASRTK